MQMFRDPKRWLFIGALVLFMPVFSVAQRGNDRHHHRGGGGSCGGDGGGWDRHNSNPCQQVPDGGSTFGYLLALGTASLGAIFVRSRLDKSRIT